MPVVDDFAEELLVRCFEQFFERPKVGLGPGDIVPQFQRTGDRNGKWTPSPRDGNGPRYTPLTLTLMFGTHLRTMYDKYDKMECLACAKKLTDGQLNLPHVTTNTRQS